jgi:Dolichyl-phosphate-mannose-protein mannosyltransferase
MKVQFLKHIKRKYLEHLVFCVVFFIGLQTFNIYAPLTEGWWHVYTRWIDLGKIPYRDFELLVPPGYPYLLWIITSIFGEAFYTLRLLGILIQSITAVIIYRLLLGQVSNLLTSIISIFATFLLYSGIASVPFDYNYIAVLFSLLAFERTKSNLYLRRERFRRSNVVLIGFITSLAFLVKQTFGLSTLVFVMFAVLFSKIVDSRKMLSLILGLVSGFSFPILIVGIYLAINGALNPAIEQIFINSTEVKGGAVQIFSSWIQGLFTPESISGAMRFACVIIVIAISFRNFNRNQINNSVVKNSLLDLFEKFVLPIFVFLSLVMITLLLKFTGYLDVTHIVQLLNLSRNHFFIDPVLICILILARSKKYSENPGLIVSTLAAISFLFGTGVSGGISEFGIFLTVALSLIYLISLFGNSFLLELGFIAFSMLLIFGLFINRLDVPYAWWNYKVASAKNATSVSDFGLSKGLHFSPAQLKLYDAINRFVEDSKNTCGSQIYVYPAMPLFQLNAGLLPPGYLGNYWFDFSSKPGIGRQLEYIQERGIDAVVYLEVPKYITDAHSQLFQGGKELPQNLLAETFKSYLSSLPTSSISKLSVEGIEGEFLLGPLDCSNSQLGNFKQSDKG